MKTITGLNHIILAVNDLEKSLQFYEEVLGFNPLYKWPDGAYFFSGRFVILLRKR